MKTAVLITGLLLIVLANFMALYYAPYGMRREYFQNATNGMNGVATNGVATNGMATNGMATNGVATNGMATNGVATNGMATNGVATNGVAANGMNANVNEVETEGFSSNLENAAGARDSYRPMGQFDGVKLSTGNTVSGWRYTAPNEPLTGAEFVPGDDSLFMFKNNQCKPECCGASFSCGGGCVCTTPQQRQYIAGRGGNRNTPEDSL
jgi:hypothetical protein